MKKTKTALFSSVVALILCFSMLLGTTFAWFTDSVESGKNQIVAGNLDIELYWSDDAATWHRVDEKTNIFKENAKWEPGYTEVVYLKIVNEGSLALKYQLGINVAGETGSVNVLGEEFKLSQHIRFGVAAGEKQFANRNAAVEAVDATATALNQAYTSDVAKLASTDEQIVTLVVYMPTSVGNEANHTKGAPIPTINLGIRLQATQVADEMDSFGPDYDENATFPELKPGSITADISGKVQGSVLTEAVAMVSEDGAISAVVPAGTKVSGNSLILSVSELSATGSNITLQENEILRPMDVHIEGVAQDNKEPILVTVKEAMMKGLNIGNYTLYHVEQSGVKVMTADALDQHNGFAYDPATGDVTVALATFSEVTMVAEPAKWEGNFDYSWYTNAAAPADGEAVTEYIIANADQLAAFGAIVGGMNGQTKNSFAGKTVKLIADINLGDKESENNPNIIFYPIGYYNSEGTYERTNTAITSGLRNFEGTFDGNGHTVSNFYHNTWEMKGDHNWYSPEEQYYRDGMGLFGRVYKGTVKNLTVKNFSSDGEIATTGVIAAYADGATFENIAIFNCNPRVYNIGNGGIVGCVGWYAKEANLKTTFKNITVDNSNKISALWGSYDVACGGIVGQYYPTSGQSSVNYPVNAGIDFENCHISAQMDVYNDVCANYQYYAYRYTGMLIGSVRENVTIDGKSYPKMDGITAKDCTVHFGTWNDYYYCEIIDNTTASYTHDYQMSRLTEVKAIDGTTITYLDGTTGTVPASGRANYVIVDYSKGHGTENATCYHFKDGAVWTHDMGGIQTGIDENGDGKDDLKEDKQHIYLEFNNLVTGYGWGVTTKGVDDVDGVTILDRVVADSKVKFEKADTAKESYMNGKPIVIGELFKAAKLDDEKLVILNPSVNVTVSPVGENSTVDAIYTANTSDWTQGTLIFRGTGAAKITITDYYFCTPTIIEVNVTEREAEKKFDVVMNNGDFLHRVGNVGTVALNKLFKAKDGVSVGTVSVTIEAVNGTAASGTYTSNATWTNGTIQFSGTGVVKVTITDNDYCIPTELYLEVVDATNATGATKTTANNVVLLNNATASSLEISNGYSFYGNGFTLTFDGDGSYRSAAVSYGFVTVSNGGILDNVQIRCKIFPESYLYTNEMQAGSDGRYPYGYSAVITSGDATISNSYIYGARNNIQVGEGNVLIDNTVVECGSLSNIHIKSKNSYTVTLKDVTTIQYPTTDDFGKNKKVMGLGVLVGTNESESNPTIKLQGDFKQYNWVTASTASGLSNTYAQSAINGALDITKYQHKQTDGTITVNMGIAYMNTLDAQVDDVRVNKSSIPYVLQGIRIASKDGQVCSIADSSITNATERYDASKDGILPYRSTVNRPIAPKVSHTDSANANISCETLFENGEWITKFSADLDKINGGSYSFKFSDLSVTKYGIPLNFTVKDASGNAVDKNTVITLNQLMKSNYTLIITDNQLYNAKGENINDSVTVEAPFVLSATKTSIEPPKFTNAGTATAIRLVSSKGGDWRPAYTVLTGVTVTYWSASESEVKTVDLSTLYNSGTISSNVWTYTCNDYTLTITGGQVHSDGSKITPVVSNSTLYFASTNKAFTTGTTSRSIILTYVFTDKNDSTTWNRNETVQYSSLSEYDYDSFKKGTLEEPSSGGPCFTPDTLVTLADGSQKRVDELQLTDKILAWDFFTGSYVEKNISLLVNHGASLNDVIYTSYSDGTLLKLVGEHGVFDYDLNKFVYITANNVTDFIGHRFVKQNLNGGYDIVTMTDGYVKCEYVEAWSVSSAVTSNAFASGLLTVAPPEDFYNWIEMDDKLHYDVEQFQKDVQTYGLYTYEDFKDYVTYEQFVDWNGAYLKIAVEKGYFTFEYILELIELYKGWMPNG